VPFSGNQDVLSEPANLRACDTIDQRLKLANSSRFEQMAGEHYEIDSEKKALSFDEELYWETSSIEGDPISDDDDDDECEIVHPDVAKPDKRHRCTIGQAWSSDQLQKPRTLAFDNKTFNFVFATLLCDCCFLGSSAGLGTATISTNCVTQSESLKLISLAPFVSWLPTWLTTWTFRLSIVRTLVRPCRKTTECRQRLHLGAKTVVRTSMALGTFLCWN